MVAVVSVTPTKVAPGPKSGVEGSRKSRINWGLLSEISAATTATRYVSVTAYATAGNRGGKD